MATDKLHVECPWQGAAPLAAMCCLDLTVRSWEAPVLRLETDWRVLPLRSPPSPIQDPELRMVHPRYACPHPGPGCTPQPLPATCRPGCQADRPGRGPRRPGGRPRHQSRRGRRCAAVGVLIGGEWILPVQPGTQGQRQLSDTHGT